MAAQSDDIEPWDKEIRSEQYSIKNKRQKFEAFRESPTVETLKNAAETWWATVARWSIDPYVSNVVLVEGHTPEDIRVKIQQVVENSRPITDANIPGMRVATLTEVLEIIDPEQFATLNSKAREGMEALGYNVPEENVSNEEYRAFVADVKDAVVEYNLRSQLDEREEVGDISDEPDIDVAQAAFNMHVEDKFDFDLGEVRESDRKKRVEEVELPRGLYEKVDEVVSGNLLYTDEEDYIKTKLREAVREDND
jgi:hypothetical protein